MANKRFSDVSPQKGDKDSGKEGIKSSAKTKPQSNPSDGSFAKGGHARGGAPSNKGGKDLPAQKFEEHTHQEPSGELPKSI